jgi:hypothetical protein
MQFYILKLVTPQSHLLGGRKILHTLTVLKETPQDRGYGVPGGMKHGSAAGYYGKIRK